jgi:endoglucanase
MSAAARFVLALAVLVCAGLAAPAAQAEPLTPAEQVRTMGRGMNILGYDPLWRDPAQARFKTPHHMRVIREGGFSHVRIVLQAFRHMDAENKLSPQFLDTLDRMVGAALTQGLVVILDEHDFNACGADPAPCRPKLMAFWEQIAERYTNAPDQVLFEILNEPNRELDAVWNDWLVEALGIIRRTNPTRNVILGPANGNSIDALEGLRLPADDRHLIVTVHYYLPFRFTHQGAPWVEGMRRVSGVTWGSDADRAELAANFDAVQRWAEANDRPIYLGEFGAYDRAPQASRVAYTGAVAREAERHGWAWGYWQFDSDFIAYDIDADHWNEPIYRALVPAAD